MAKSKTSYEQIRTTPSSEIRALELIPFIEQVEAEHPVIAIAGESGSGKSTTATSLQLELQKIGVRALIIHLDNYFKEIPSINEEIRRTEFDRIGLPEIDIHRLQTDINTYREGADSILVPVLSADRMNFLEVEIELGDVDLLIVEGTFAFDLDHLDLKIFLEFHYEKSRARRISRGRDKVDEFSEKVLKREHALLQPYSSMADIIINDEGILRKR